jgi:hypothetical protein
MAERIDRSLLIRKLVPNNPRQEQTHGWYAWECLRDGMTVQEYLDAPYDPDAFIRQKGRSNRPFTGPAILHLETDLENGFIELYQHADVAA